MKREERRLKSEIAETVYSYTESHREDTEIHGGNNLKTPCCSVSSL
jgi:hypothetical protein